MLTKAERFVGGVVEQAGEQEITPQLPMIAWEQPFWQYICPQVCPVGSRQAVAQVVGEAQEQ